MKKYITGIDEVGRGPLAGPVTVCAVRIEWEMYKKLQKNKDLPALGRDSKKLSKKKTLFSCPPYHEFLQLLTCVYANYLF